MGQYYLIANIDKREYFSPCDLNSGVKLTEWTYLDDKCNQALLNLMADKWKGDRVYVVGDYAYTDRPDDIYYDLLDSISEELGFKGEEICYVNVYGDLKRHKVDLYDFVEEHFTHLEKFSIEKNIRFVYNKATGQFVDLEHANIAWGEAHMVESEIQARVIQYAQLPLLIAMGNGRGLGDYPSPDEDTVKLVGSWCQYSQDLEVSATPLQDYWSFIEYQPNFHEQEIPIPYPYCEVIKEILCQDCLRQVEAGTVPERAWAYLRSTAEDIEAYKKGFNNL